MLDGLPGAVDIASAIPPDHDGRARPRSTPAAAAGRRRARRSGSPPRRRAPTTSWPRPATQIEAALAAAGYAGAARFEIDERGLVVHIVADAVLFDAEEAVLRPEGRRDPRRRRAHPDRPAERAARRGPRQPPAGHRAAARGRRTGSCRPTARRTVLALPRRRRRARGADVRDRLLARPGRWCPSTDPDARSPSTAASTSSSCPPPRQRPTPCCRASTPPHRGGTAMSTKEKPETETDEDAGQGRQEEADPDLGRGRCWPRPARRTSSCSPAARPRPRRPSTAATSALEPIAVNLAGGGYLKIGITLELTDGRPPAAVTAAPASTAPRRYDLIISTFSQAKPGRRHRCPGRAQGGPRAEDHRGLHRGRASRWSWASTTPSTSRSRPRRAPVQTGPARPGGAARARPAAPRRTTVTPLPSRRGAPAPPVRVGSRLRR